MQIKHYQPRIQITHSKKNINNYIFFTLLALYPTAL